MEEMKKIMVALDDMNDIEAISFLKKWPKDSLPTVKIGLEMYYRFGPSFVKEVYDKFGVDIFLDLKLHDIPNTVSKSIRSLNSLPIKYLTIHLSGGEKMIASALSEAKTSLPKTKILGVSFPARELEWFLNIQDNYSNHPIKVTPGIRFSDEIASGGISDQVRVETPESALKKGADFLVLGRSLTKTTSLDGRIEELKILLNKR